MNRELWNVKVAEKAVIQKSKSSAITVNVVDVEDASFDDG